VAKKPVVIYRVSLNGGRVVSRIPKLRKHKPSKQAVVTLNGRDIYLGKYGTHDSRELYRKLIAEYLASNGQEVPPDLRHAKQVPNITVLDAADRYLTRSCSKVEKAHVRGMLKCLLKLYENEKCAAIGPVALREVRRVMIAKGWSRSYFNNQIARVKRMFKWLVNEELIPASVHQALALVDGLRHGRSAFAKRLRSASSQMQW
jgi:hypothetical protein